MNSTRKTLDELHKLINSRNPSIRTFMLDNGYIKVHDARFPKDIADDPGKKAKELGGHQQYVAWKAKQDKAKRFRNYQ